MSVIILLSGMLSAADVLAASSAALRLEQEIMSAARQKTSSVLGKYCGDACEVINVEAVIDEFSGENEELGFESIAQDSAAKLSVAKINVELQVDDRVSAADRDRLGKIVGNSLRGLGNVVDVRWSSVAFPQIGVSAEVEDRLKSQLQQKLMTTVQGVLDSYCPKECILTNVAVDGRLIAPDDARGLPEKELVRDKGGRGILRLDNVDIDVSLDQKMSEANRTRVHNLIKARVKFVYPVNVNMGVVDFPENPASKGAEDPWGLDRLRQTLQIFRDLASTKEIITNTKDSTSSTVDSKATNATERNESRESREQSSLTAKEKSTESEKNSVTASQSVQQSSKASEISATKSEGQQNMEYALYIGAFLLLAGIIVALMMRMSSTSRDAKLMMESMPSNNNGGWRQPPQQMAPSHDGVSVGSQNVNMMTAAPVTPERMSMKIRIELLKEELLRSFTENPKVARDTFTRMLQEDGVEATSRFVYLFGPMIIFELMRDPNLQRDLYDLSEFYHKSSFHFSDEQTLELLQSLKTRVTASEIRVMSRKRTEQFEFLQNLDASQVFTLIGEEKPQVQSIVLTQLDPNRRRTVFDMYAGEAKVALMRELCRADAIPKEYLGNVAKALHKKVLSRNEFDTEQLRSNDIILDLLEKANLEEQRSLMADLVETNPEAARAIKLKLVTIEMLGYLKDGHLLEIVMGLEREDLLAFLVGTRDHVRDLLLAKAPTELSQSWVEDIEQMSGVDDATYRMAELKIVNRIRTLANSGVVRLIDINDRLFAEEHLASSRQSRSQIEMAISRNSMAA